MSTQFPDDPRDPEVESTPEAARKRALQVLGLLVLVGVVVSAIMIFVFGSSGSSDGDQAAGPDLSGSAVVIAASPTPVPAPAAPATPAAPAATPTPAAATSAACPSATPCALAGDAGQAGDAINAYRASHQVGAVTTDVSPDAQTCALSSGSRPSCPPSYYWEPVPALQGSALVSKIASKSAGSTWLLDPTAKSFTVGWSYAPGAAGKAGQIAAVIVKTG